MVFEGDISEKAVGLAISKKKLDPYLGHGPMGLDLRVISDLPN